LSRRALSIWFVMCFPGKNVSPDCDHTTNRVTRGSHAGLTRETALSNPFPRYYAARLIVSQNINITSTSRDSARIGRPPASVARLSSQYDHVLTLPSLK
jgi:hypothetical protein